MSNRQTTKFLNTFGNKRGGGALGLDELVNGLAKMEDAVNSILNATINSGPTLNNEVLPTHGNIVYNVNTGSASDFPFKITIIGGKARIAPGWVQVQFRGSAQPAAGFGGLPPVDGDQEYLYEAPGFFPGTGIPNPYDPSAAVIPDLPLSSSGTSYITIYVNECAASVSSTQLQWNAVVTYQDPGNEPLQLSEWYWGSYPTVGFDGGLAWTQQFAVGTVASDQTTITQYLRDNQVDTFAVRPVRYMGVWSPSIAYFGNEVVSLSGHYSFDPTGLGHVTCQVQTAILLAQGTISYNNRPTHSNMGTWAPWTYFTLSIT